MQSLLCLFFVSRARVPESLPRRILITIFQLPDIHILPNDFNRRARLCLFSHFFFSFLLLASSTSRTTSSQPLHLVGQAHPLHGQVRQPARIKRMYT